MGLDEPEDPVLGARRRTVIAVSGRRALRPRRRDGMYSLCSPTSRVSPFSASPRLGGLVKASCVAVRAPASASRDARGCRGTTGSPSVHRWYIKVDAPARSETVVVGATGFHRPRRRSVPRPWSNQFSRPSPQAAINIRIARACSPPISECRRPRWPHSYANRNPVVRFQEKHFFSARATTNVTADEE